ncbi:MAG: right-handed parallel beta-helix repeat-containing protein, partial [Lentisphaerae bacterium]|nr:right-handed parallel beta-helix repeat-containing protein [Lentisphaerota bacterium]
VADVPPPPGYTHYQIIEQDDPAFLSGTWHPLNTMTQVSFTQPVGDQTVTLYAWLTNTLDSVPLGRAAAEINYTTALPQPAVHENLLRETAGFTVRLWPEDINAGSTGGLFAGAPIPIHSMEALCVDDETPADEFATLDGAGEYQLLLKVVNAAGNVATSALACSVSVQEATDPPTDGQRYVAVGNLHAAAPYDSWTTAAASIQDAVNSADSGDVIRVWAGRYRAPPNAVDGNGALNVVNIDRPVTIISVGSADDTLIDGNGQNRPLRINYADTVIPLVIDGFAITNGLAPSGGGAYYNNNNNITHYLNCNFISNIAAYTKSSHGGGIYAGSARLVVSNCVFRHNRVIAPALGGAIYKIGGRAEIYDSIFEDNTANHTTHQYGGALVLTGSSNSNTIERTQFLYNRASTSGNAGSGGGAIAFRGNNGILNLRGCLFIGNVAYNPGGVIRLQSDTNMALTFENCTLVNNSARAISIRGGSGVLSLYNTVFYDNTSNDIATIPAGWKPVIAFNNNIMSLQTAGDFPDFAANNNTSVDPEFVDLAGGNLRLTPGSPSRNTGLNQPAWMFSASDPDGNARISGATVDRGCYEYPFAIEPSTDTISIGAWDGRAGAGMLEVANNGMPTNAWLDLTRT